MEIKLGGETDAHQLIEGDQDIADTATAWVRFTLFISKNFDATADDIWNIYEFNSAAAVERAVSLRYVAATDVINIGVGKVAGTVWGTENLQRGRWYTVEAKTVIQTGGTGTGDVYLDGTLAAAITTLTDLAVTTGSLGTKNTLTTTSGYLFFDQFVFDDLRVYPISQRFPESVLITKSQHVFLGSGNLENATLLPGAATDGYLQVFDTDNASVLDASNVKLELHNVVNADPVDPAGVPVQLNRGCYVQLTGTTPRAMIAIGSAQGYWSAGRIRDHGARRKQAPGNW
jgi:hypothetical protein